MGDKKIPKISKGVIIAIATIGVFLVTITTGQLLSMQTIGSSGAVTAVNVGVYSNYQCTENCTSISWGTVSPGSTVTRTIYIKNIGNMPLTLSMSTASWSPSNADDYLTLTCNRQDTVLDSGEQTTATLTLTVDSDTGSLTDFSFNIIVTGTE